MSFHSWLWIIRQYIHIYVCRRSKVAREPNLPSAYVTSVYFESSASLFPSHPQINTGAAHRTLVLAKARDKKIYWIDRKLSKLFLFWNIDCLFQGSKVAREPNLPSAYVTSVYFESSASLFPSHPQINTGAAHRTLVLAKARDKKYIGIIKNC